MQSTADIQEPVLGSWVIPSDRQDFRLQAKLRNLFSTSPQEEETLRRNWPHECLSPLQLYPFGNLSSTTCPYTVHKTLTRSRVRAPSTPAGLIPRGPSSKIAPSDPRTERIQPPKRLLPSTKITWRQK